MDIKRSKFFFIPDSLWDEHVSLASFGIPSPGWRISTAEQVLLSAQNAGIGVLGGDLYDQINSESIIDTYTNWHTDPLESENPAIFVRRSHAEARDFLFRAKHFKVKCPVVDIVFDI